MAGESLGSGMVDNLPPSGEDIHAGNGEGIDDLWGSDEPSNTSVTTAQPSSPAGKPAEPIGDYDYDDPALRDLDAAREEAEAEAEPEVGVRGSKGQAVGTEFRPDQLMRATKLGYSPEEVADFATPRALETALRREERLRTSVATHQQQAAQQAVNPFAQYANPQYIAQQAAANLKPKIDKQALIDAGYDEGMVSQFEKMLEATSKQTVEALAAQYAPAFANAAQLHKFMVEFSGAVAKSEQQRSQREMQQGVDAWNKEFRGYVSKLPEEWQRVIKKGDNERELHTACGVLQQTYIGLGKKPPEGEQLFHEAISFKFKDKMQSVARDQVRRDVEQRQRRSVARARPSGGTVPQSGDQAAIKFWTQNVSGKTGASGGRRF